MPLAGLGVLSFHRKALLRTNFDTGSARDTTQPIDGPRFFFFAHDNSLSRAFTLAQTAKDTAFNINGNASPAAIKKYLLFEWIFCGRGPEKKRLDQCFEDSKKAHSLTVPYS